MKNKILNLNDIVKVNNINLIIIYIYQNTYTGQNMNGKKINFLIDDIQKIIFDSSSQLTVKEVIKKDKLTVLKDSLIDINNKLKSSMTLLTNIKTLKKLRTRIKEQIKELEPGDSYIQNQLF